MNRFQGKTAFVTGGAAGIGAGIIQRLHAEGASVIIADKDLGAAERLALSLGTRTLPLACDVTQPEQIRAAIDTTVERFGRIDVLCNNAGIGVHRTTAELDPAMWQAVMDTGINGVYHASKLALPHLRAVEGVIVNIASISGLAADYGFAAYNASKGAIINYTRAMAIDHAREGIRVNAICPGFIDTPASRVIMSLEPLFQTWVKSIPMQRIGTPSEIGAAVAFLASTDASFITGAVLVADGGVSAWTGQPNISAVQGGDVEFHRPTPTARIGSG
jgi:meso-butanediol dehydrogenase / (S,S)-butanediol dehydrogenase / diacetyl reductase